MQVPARIVSVETIARPSMPCAVSGCYSTANRRIEMVVRFDGEEYRLVNEICAPCVVKIQPKPAAGGEA